jgi:hypothetical protein
MSDWTPVPTADHAVVDGVNVDAVAAAVRACPGVEALHGGHPQRIATYLPGRRIEGVRIERQAVVVQVRTRWGVPAVELAAQIRATVAPLAAGRRIDIVIADVGDPPSPLPAQVGGTGRVGTAAQPPASPIASAVITSSSVSGRQSSAYGCEMT